MLDKEIAAPTKHALTDSVTTNQKSTPEATKSAFRKREKARSVRELLAAKPNPDESFVRSDSVAEPSTEGDYVLHKSKVVICWFQEQHRQRKFHQQQSANLPKQER